METTIAYTWPESEYESKPLIVQEARALLEKWFVAMEDGTVTSWMPDPMYATPISMDAADAMVAELTTQFDFDLKAWAYTEAAGSYDAGPGFDRLLPPQRLALAQQLHALKRKHGVKPITMPTYDGFYVS